MRKIIFPQKKKNLGDLGIYPASPSYSLTLTFNEATIFTVTFNTSIVAGTIARTSCLKVRLTHWVYESATIVHSTTTFNYYIVP